MSGVPLAEIQMDILAHPLGVGPVRSLDPHLGPPHLRRRVRGDHEWAPLSWSVYRDSGWYSMLYAQDLRERS